MEPMSAYNALQIIFHPDNLSLDNRFIPDPVQIIILKSVNRVIPIRFGDMDPVTWYNTLATCVDPDNGLPLIFSLFGSYSVSVWEDQIVRARHIVRHMINNNIRVLRTMDGHGRFVFAFFHALIEHHQNLEDYSVELIDTDSMVNTWHIHFCPTNVTVEPEQSILDTSDVPFLTGMDTTDRLPRLMYLNYCSVPDDNLDDISQVMENCTIFGLRIYITYSTRAVGRFTKKGRCFRQIKKEGTCVCVRGNQVTAYLGD